MQGDRLERAERIFHALADLPAAERAAHLNEHCGDDSELRAFVERLLRHHDSGGGKLDSPIFPDAAGKVDPLHLPKLEEMAGPVRRENGEPGRMIGKTIGHYEILEPIGEGGMGIVYLAEQTEPVRRRVALKIIKLGMDTKQVVARFEAERQALAMMDHPNIAKILDAGATPEGRPYFVMEHVHGIPLTDYCDRHNLKMPERLEIFTQVCEAIQHAHQKGVIHRDLKPSNVLVEVVDDHPVPKVIDFGIAKATAQRLTERTVYTEQGQLIGTPEYMSPEQAEMTGLNVDTRTDIYSLGVLLYELLVGSLPFEAETLRRASYAEIQRILMEVDPPKPSTRLSSLRTDAETIVKRRRTDRSSLLSQLRGDLDWITMKALEKDRTRRYASASEFAADIRRFLNDEPVVARPPSAAYRMRKYVRRHRVGVGFATTIMLAVAAGFVLMTIQNAKIAASRDEAEVVTATLEEMLASVDSTKSGRDVTVKEMLDEAAKRLGEKFQDQPLIEARLRHTVGWTYYELGEYDAAEEHLERAVGIRTDRLGEEDPETLYSMHGLAAVRMEQGRYDEAVALERETLAISRRVLGEEHPLTLWTMEGLANTYGRQLRYPEAQALMREVLETRRLAFGDEHLQTLYGMHNLAVWSLEGGRLDEAESLLQESLEVDRRVLGEEHPLVLMVMSNLAECYRRQGRSDEAETLQKETLEIKRRVLGEEHPNTLWSLYKLAGTYRDQGRLEDAETLYRETLEIRERVLGEEHPLTLYTSSQLAYTVQLQGHFTDAEALMRKTLATSRRALGEKDKITNAQRYNVACILALQGRRDEAIAFLREACDHGHRRPDILDDPDLASLHGDPEFEAIVEELKRRNEEGEPATVE